MVERATIYRGWVSVDTGAGQATVRITRGRGGRQLGQRFVGRYNQSGQWALMRGHVDEGRANTSIEVGADTRDEECVEESTEQGTNASGGESASWSLQNYTINALKITLRPRTLHMSNIGLPASISYCTITHTASTHNLCKYSLSWVPFFPCRNLQLRIL